MEKIHRLSFRIRESLYATVLLFYLLPVLIFSKHSIGLMSADKSWTVISIGLMLSLFGSALFIVLIRNWEERVREKSLRFVPATQENKIMSLHHSPEAAEDQIANLEAALDESQQQSQQLISEMEGYKTSLHQVSEENGTCLQRLKSQQKEYEEYRRRVEQTLSKSDQALTEARQSEAQLHRQLEEQQRRTAELESKNRDLSYEVKTLLELEDRESASKTATTSAHNFHPVMNAFAEENDVFDDPSAASSERRVRTPYDAQAELKRCIDIARDLKGAAHLSDGTSRLGADAYAIDLRRLFDKFRHETSSPIVLYHPGEEKVLFASNQVTGLLGWNPEKFACEFFNLIQEGAQRWREASQSLDGVNAQTVSLVIKTEGAGADLLVHSYIDKVPTGPFSDHVIGVFLPD